MANLVGWAGGLCVRAGAGFDFLVGLSWFRVGLGRIGLGLLVRLG